MSKSSTSAQALTENYIPTGIDTIFYTSLTLGILFAAVIIIAYKEYKWLTYALFIAILTTNVSIGASAGLDGSINVGFGNHALMIYMVMLGEL